MKQESKALGIILLVSLVISCIGVFVPFVHALTGTFGYTSVGNTTIPSVSSETGLVCGYHAAPSDNGAVNSISAYVYAQSGTVDLEGALYTYAGPGTPGTLIATTSEITIGTTPQWNNMTFSSPPNVTAGTQYWIVWWQDGWTYYCYNPNVMSGIGFYILDMSGFPNFPSTFAGENVVSSSAQRSIYAAYTISISASISPVSATLDVDQSQTFSSSASGGLSPYSYQWYLNGTAVSGATNSSWTWTPSSAASYTIYLNVTDSAGYWATSNTASFTVNPALACSIAPTSGTIDANQSLNFTASVSSGTLSYFYQWYLNGSAVGVDSSTYKFKAASVGSYSVYVKVTDSANVPVTVDSNTATVTVNAALGALTLTPSRSTVDQDQTSILTSSLVTTGTSPYTYQWFQMAPGGSYVTVGTSSTSYAFVTTGTTAVGSYSFVLQVTDAAGVAVNSTAATVMVNAALVALTVTSSPSTVDQGQTSVLSNSTVISTGTPSYSYQWFEMAPGSSAYSAIGGATLTSYSFVTSVSTTVGVWYFELNVTDATGAVVTSNAVSATVNLVPSVSISPSSVALDVGQSQVFTATASGGTGPLSIEWYVNGQAVGTGATYNFSAKSAGSDSIYATVTDSASSPYAATSNTATVTVNSAPTVSVTPASWTLDVGQSETFTATASGGSGTYLSYQWYVDGQLQLGQTSTFVYSPSAGSQGTHSITVKVTDSLDATSPQSSPATVKVNVPLGAPTVTSSPGTVDQGETGILTSSLVTTGTSPYSYQWFGKAPGGSYAAVGSDLASFSFVTSGATATGSWSFILQVKDNVGVAVNSSAVSVVVNAALVAPTVTSSSGAVDQGQTSILTSSSVTTGTSPYTYQWFQMAPGSSAYSAIGGATLTDYSFVTSVSTTTGVWHFKLNVTDATGAVVTSLVVSVTVNLVPSVSISPTTVVMGVGQPQTFTATVSGGTSPFSYRWYLNGTSVLGATNATWTFTPSSEGYYSVYVKVTDVVSVTATSNNSNVNVIVAHPVTSIGGGIGITGYKLVFEEAMNNSFGSPATIGYYWSFFADKWNGTQWIASGISGSTTPVVSYSIAALTLTELPYCAYVLPMSGPNAVAWGNWLWINFTFHWTQNSFNYSTNDADELNVHPGDIAGAAEVFPYLGADGFCNLLDVTPIALNWLKKVPTGTDPTSGLAIADINGDGVVNLKDVTVIALSWLKAWKNTPPQAPKAGKTDSQTHSAVTLKSLSQTTLIRNFLVDTRDVETDTASPALSVHVSPTAASITRA